MRKHRGFWFIAMLLGVLLGAASCETHYVDEGSGGARYPRPEAVLSGVGVFWTDPATVPSLEGLMRAVAYAPADADAAYAAYAPAGGEGWVNPGAVNPVVPDDNFLKIYQAAWNRFQWQIEPRPYVYDKGSNSTLRDYKHDGEKSVYDGWVYDVGSKKWYLNSAHEAGNLVLALDRYWADTLDNAYGWTHEHGGAGIFRSDRDKVRWKAASSARMRRAAYTTLYKQIEKAYYDLKLFVDAYGVANHPIVQELLTDMGSYIKSNVDAYPSQNSVKVDHSVWNNIPIPELLAPPYNDSLRFGRFNAQTAMLTNMVMEQQQQGSTASPSRVVTSRGKLFEFFFGCIDVDGQYIPFSPGEVGFPVFSFDIVTFLPTASLGVTWGDPQPSFEWKDRERNMPESRFIDTIKVAIANWDLFEKSIDPRPYYHAPGSAFPSVAANAYEVFSRASASAPWALDYHEVWDTIIIKRYWSNTISPSPPTPMPGSWQLTFDARVSAFKTAVANIQGWMAQMQASALWHLDNAGIYPLRQLYDKMAAFIGFPSTLTPADRNAFSYNTTTGFTTSATLPGDKTYPLFEYFFGFVPQSLTPHIRISWPGINTDQSGKIRRLECDELNPVERKYKLTATIENALPGFDYLFWTFDITGASKENTSAAGSPKFSSTWTPTWTRNSAAVEIEAGANIATRTIYVWSCNSAGVPGIVEDSITVAVWPKGYVPTTGLRLKDANGVEIHSSSVIRLRVGETKPIFADVTPFNADIGAVTWSVSGGGNAYVDVTPVGSASQPWLNQEVSIQGVQSTPALVTVTAATIDGLTASFHVVVLTPLTFFFTEVPGGYVGPAFITYMSGATLDVVVTTDGTLEYDAFNVVPTGTIKSLTLTDPSLGGGNKTYRIGRAAPSYDAAHPIVLNLKSNGELDFRPAGGSPGFIPIGSYAEFQLISSNTSTLDADYKQEADLELMNEPGYYWEPVGSSAAAFTGTFDGDRKTLSNLSINMSGAEPAGVFGVVGGTGKVRNVGIVNGTVTGTGGSNVGSIAGQNNGTIFACYNNAAVNGTGHVGGIAGNSEGEITACYNTGDVTGGIGGGVAGLNNNGSITACYNKGAVIGTTNTIGGVAGRNGGPIAACYNANTVSGGSSRGGIAGVNAAPINDCYWESFPSLSGSTGAPMDAASSSFTNGFTPNDATGNWGTGDGSGPGKYWKPNTVNGKDGQSGLTTLPQLFFE
ncbi:GLUG domain-containing protein [Candidatus Symbiothrix dinenymphae]|nr:GLUG domain-containing protein [Candidatus Symbiothrix dinenymphae]